MFVQIHSSKKSWLLRQTSKCASSIVSKTHKFATLTENDLLAVLNSMKECSKLEWQEAEDDDNDKEDDGNFE